MELEDKKRRNRFYVWFIFTLLLMGASLWIGYQYGYKQAQHEYGRIIPHIKQG
tara:strand:- start:96787 stop:96945 length:159 start_codon:yes stop_codon:yes gene_type:complete